MIKPQPLVLAALALLCAPAWAQVYRCPDASGRTVIQLTQHHYGTWARCPMLALRVYEPQQLPRRAAAAGARQAAAACD